MSTLPSTQYSRRRRVSVSGKLLGLFGGKFKDAEPEARPVISRPMPLERRVPSSINSSNTVALQPVRRKRDYREASLDSNENGDNRISKALSEDRRAASRPRLDFNVAAPRSSPAAHPARPSADKRSVPPLKSALKKSESKSNAMACSSGTPVAKDLWLPRSSHTAGKGSLNPTMQHNGGDSELSSPFNHGLRDEARIRDAPEVAGIHPSSPLSSTSYRNATAVGRTPHKAQKKTVTFADENPRDTMVALTRSRTADDITNVWMDHIQPLDVLYSTPPALPPATSPSTVHVSPLRPAAQRRRSDPAARIPNNSSRAYGPVPALPHIDSRRASAIQHAAKAVIEKSKEAEARAHDEFRMLLARQAPPTPEATLKREPFKLPVGLAETVQLKPGGWDEKENGMKAKDLLDEVLQDIARDSEARERGDMVPKPVFAPVTQSDVLRRFKADIHPDQRHATIWDGKETDVYAWSGTLVVQDTKPASYFYPRHSLHDFSIQFHTTEEPRQDPHTFNPNPTRTKHEWQSTYTGRRISAASRGPSGIPTLDPALGVVVETDVRLLPGDPDGPCQWEVRFWVPVPLRLFVRAEHRTFVCRAKVTVKDWETPKTEVPAGCIAVGIERLKTERLLGRSSS
ncbi:hypothetical protein BN946_scf184803.g8 [Trametes cinnabarina]|uniref:Uncharacterized protein n=1 Tax=Pycnoporus cinnabarinus TaxID=5643 RepID=A0A060S663_PYCCI|nr:hypothetical protein BN946_scf184803.g8 [Trametes cinnabarina]